jgi:hypothetical protein
MARLGIQVNLANRIKRVGNYTELYLCKKMFSYVCYDLNILTTGKQFAWRTNYTNTYVSKEKSEYIVKLWVPAQDITISSNYITIVKLGLKTPITIDFNDDLRKLYMNLDFSNLYWNAIKSLKTSRYFDH